MRPRFDFSQFLRRLGRMALLVASGGGWSAQIAAPIQRNMRWFFLDGVMSASQDAINVTYLTLFILALGASKTQIGLMASLASIGSMALLIPGALLTERTGKRKRMVLIGGGGISRLGLLGLAVLPFFASGPTAIAVAIALKIIMDSFANLSTPAWTSLTSDIIPIRWRGRYFGTRYMIMGIANILVTLLAGQIITAADSSIGGYQSVLGLAVVFGSVASFSFAHIQDPPTQPNPAVAEMYKPRALLQTLQNNPFFLRFCLAQVVWNFSLAIAGPFFGVYQVEVLKSTPAIIGLMAVISPLAAIPAQPIFGRLNDSWGERKVLTLTGFLIPIMAALWALTRGPWDPAPLNIFGGVIWAGYNIAIFTFLLTILPEGNKARYTAVYQFLMLLSAAAGSALGGVLIDVFDFRIIFIVTGVGRLIGHLMLVSLFRLKPAGSEPVQDEPAETTKEKSNEPAPQSPEVPLGQDDSQELLPEPEPAPAETPTRELVDSTNRLEETQEGSSAAQEDASPTARENDPAASDTTIPSDAPNE